MQKYIHFIQSRFVSVDTEPFAPKGIPYCQQTTIDTVVLYIRDDTISIRQDISLVLVIGFTYFFKICLITHSI